MLQRGRKKREEVRRVNAMARREIFRDQGIGERGDMSYEKLEKSYREKHVIDIWERIGQSR